MTEASGRADAPAQIITFYSFKGGAGRTMAVANIAWLLAAAGRRVLAVDWDLESPGLHRYLRPFLLNKELDADDSEMTRTRKVRRRFVAEKYAPVIEAFYGGKQSADVTMEITFEDGRKSTLSSTLTIHDVAARSAQKAA